MKRIATLSLFATLFASGQALASESIDSLQKAGVVGLRTNLLYDLCAIPNIGAEVTISPKLSIAGNLIYGQLSCNRHNRYWRINSVDLSLRWHLESPLEGHHIGLYLQGIAYDARFGGKGYMTGSAGDCIWKQMNYGAGVEYGYTLPLSKHFNLDFSASLGYLRNDYQTYLPQDNCNVWQENHTGQYWGLTKAEVALVWLINAQNHK